MDQPSKVVVLVQSITRIAYLRLRKLSFLFRASRASHTFAFESCRSCSEHHAHRIPSPSKVVVLVQSITRIAYLRLRKLSFLFRASRASHTFAFESYRSCSEHHAHRIPSPSKVIVLVQSITSIAYLRLRKLSFLFRASRASHTFAFESCRSCSEQHAHRIPSPSKVVVLVQSITSIAHLRLRKLSFLFSASRASHTFAFESYRSCSEHHKHRIPSPSKVIVLVQSITRIAYLRLRKLSFLFRASQASHTFAFESYRSCSEHHKHRIPSRSSILNVLCLDSTTITYLLGRASRSFCCHGLSRVQFGEKTVPHPYLSRQKLFRSGFFRILC